MRLPQYARKTICREMPAPRALRASASRAGQIEGGLLRRFAWAQPLRVFLQAPAGNGGKPHPAGQAIALRGVSASVRSYGPPLRHGKARARSGGAAMALFAGLRAGPGRLPGGRRRDRAARAGGASGERRSRQKVNAWRCAQPPENAGFGRPTLSNMANKPLKTYGGWHETGITSHAPVEDARAHRARQRPDLAKH